jgi:tetratricopeptide (TPR) repeat protein
MSEEFTLQCQSCGTLFSEYHAECPYCGEPQPIPPEYEALLREESYDEAYFEEESYGFQDERLLDEAYAPPPVNVLDYTHPKSQLGGEFDPEVTPFATDISSTEVYQPAYYEAEFQANQGGTEAPYARYTQPAYHEAPAAEVQAGYDDYPAVGDLDQVEAEPYQTNPGQALRIFTWRRLLVGCLGMILCMGLFYGAIALFAVREGLAERTVKTQAEAEEHYQKGQEHLANQTIDLAIAEFEMAISIDPNFLEARQALREAQQIAQTLPTPTSEARSAAAAELFAEARRQVEREAWAEAAETLSQVRDLDPDYEAEDVSDLIYKANYELGLQLIVPNRLDEAIAAFEQALQERPDDRPVTLEKAKATLYLAGIAAEEALNPQEALENFDQLYNEDENYLDVQRRLRQAYELVGDEFVEQEKWCLAELQFTEANNLRASPILEAKLEESSAWCKQEALTQSVTPTPTPRPTPRPTSTPAPAANTEVETVPQPTTEEADVETAEVAPPTEAPSSGGSILYSAYNPNEARWEIVSVPASGGAPRVLVTDATMPALSPNGKSLLYHAELVDSEGFHILDLTTGQDKRITLRRRDILPRWGGNNSDYLFVSQEPGTGRWQIHRGFADGKSDPIIIRDGRTPDFSPDNSMIAYQGADPQGNNPGIYLAPLGGGEAKRLTGHESDRSPDFSPDGSQIAFMSTQNGNWDIYTVSAAGGEPRQVTTNPSSDGLPAWSPDGSRIAYVSDAGGNWAIYVVGAEGGTPRRVVNWDGRQLSDWLTAQIWWGP